MSAVRHAVIRADASPSIGGGHIMRCLALAEALCAEGWTVTFAVSEETIQTVPALHREGHNCVLLSDTKASSAFREAVPDNFDLLVVDHYGLDATYETDCRPCVRNILVIDDLANRNHDCDVLIDPTLGRNVQDYGGKIPLAARVAAGPMYAPLRSSFSVARGEKRSAEITPMRVLLAMGATDAGGWLVPLLETIGQLRVDIDVVVGSSARHFDDIQAAADKFRANVHVDTPHMAKLMTDADVAVLAAGTTTWEAACMGLAIVLIVAADNQVEVARSMVNAGAAVVADTVDSAGAAVARLLDDSDARSKLSQAALSICDGLGARRIAILVAPERDKEGGAVTLRPATLADSDVILRWQQHPDTRRYSRNPLPPSRNEHETWMVKKLADPWSLLQIVLLEDSPAGFIRLDRDENNSVGAATRPSRSARRSG